MYELILQNGTSIQIAKNDFSDLCDWSSAKLKCEEIGEGWRLPTISELEEIFKKKESFNFANYGYWSYWSGDDFNSEKANAFSGVEGNIIQEFKNENFYVRAVKTNLKYKDQFKIENEVSSFLNNKKIADYLINQHKKIEKLFSKNCIEKIIKCEQINCLNIIFGEVTQNIDNFIYGNNNSKVSKNNFLNPATLLGKKCGKNSGFNSNELHDFLIEKKIIVIDLFSIPLPSEYYRNDLVPYSNSYLKFKSDIIISLIRAKNIENVKCICRYSDKNVIKLAKVFIEFIQKDGINVFFDENSLSNNAGGLDINKFNNFMSND